MKMVLTAGALCAVILFAAVSVVQAKMPLGEQAETVIPTVLIGE